MSKKRTTEADKHGWWLTSPASPCAFPNPLISADLLTVDEQLAWGEEFPSRLTTLLRGDSRRVHVVVFPWVSTIDELVRVLHAFDVPSNPRWRYRRVADLVEAPLIAVGLDWRTEHDQWTSSMGFAPLPSMPVWRRGPFLALALWPGPALSPESKAARTGRKPQPPEQLVGFGDVPTPAGLDWLKAARKSSKETQKRALPNQPRSDRWREVAFVLEGSMADRVAPSLLE